MECKTAVSVNKGAGLYNVRGGTHHIQINIIFLLFPLEKLSVCPIDHNNCLKMDIVKDGTTQSLVNGKVMRIE